MIDQFLDANGLYDYYRRSTHNLKTAQPLNYSESLELYAGQKGYYFDAIYIITNVTTPTANDISHICFNIIPETETEGRKEPTFHQESNIDNIAPKTSDLKSGFEIDDVLSFTYGSKYPRCGKVIKLDGSLIVLEVTNKTKLPVKYKKDTTDYDNFAVYCDKKPTIGYAIVKTNSIAVGEASVASGIGSMVVGKESITIDDYGFALGRKAIAGYGSLALGRECEALEEYSVATGRYCYSKHSRSNLIGYYLNSTTKDQFIVGKFNDINSSAVFAVGGGSAEADRKNLFEIDSKGNSTLLGKFNSKSLNTTSIDANSITAGSITAGSIKVDALNATIGTGNRGINGYIIGSAGYAHYAAICPYPSYISPDYKTVSWEITSTETLSSLNSIVLCDIDGKSNLIASKSRVVNENGEYRLYATFEKEVTDNSVFYTTLCNYSSKINPIDSIKLEGQSLERINHNLEQYGISLGYANSAIGHCSVAFGQYSMAGSFHSIAGGYNAVAVNKGSIALGSNVIADQEYSTAVGYGLKTTEKSQTVFGRYNDTTLTGVAFAIGGGINNNNRNNLFTVYNDGSAELNNKKVATEEFVNNLIISALNSEY